VSPEALTRALFSDLSLQPYLVTEPPPMRLRLDKNRPGPLIPSDLETYRALGEDGSENGKLASPAARSFCRLAQLAGYLGGPVGKDYVRPGPADSRQCLHDRAIPVDPAVGRRCLHHRVLAADLVGGDR
jgi:hypothetical protein